MPLRAHLLVAVGWRPRWHFCVSPPRLHLGHLSAVQPSPCIFSGHVGPPPPMPLRGNPATAVPGRCSLQVAASASAALGASQGYRLPRSTRIWDDAGCLCLPEAET